MRRSLLLFSIAVVVSGFAAMLAYKSIALKNQQIEQARVETMPILVASRDVALGARLTNLDLKTERYPIRALPAGALTRPEDVLGSVTRASFVMNEPIVKSKLFTNDPHSGVLPIAIPPGMRAISVQVDEVSDIAGFVIPHSRVDVALAVDNMAVGDRARLVVQNVEVLATAQNMESRDSKPVVVHTVTLLVTPEEAEKLALASKVGALRLVMRGLQDTKLVKTTGITLVSLVGGGNEQLFHTVSQPRTRSLPQRFQPGDSVEVMVGTTRHTVAFVKQHQATMRTDQNADSGQ